GRRSPPRRARTTRSRKGGSREGRDGPGLRRQQRRGHGRRGEEALMGQLFGATDPAADAGWQHTHPRKGFFTDTSICIGCKACEVACKEWNHVPSEPDPQLLGSSYDNTGGLGANTWRHVAFVEQDAERIDQARRSGRALVDLGMPSVGPPSGRGREGAAADGSAGGGGGSADDSAGTGSTADDYGGLHDAARLGPPVSTGVPDRKSTRLNSSHDSISYAVFCLKKKKRTIAVTTE